ncbi:glutathione binding-like protein, partial [Citrobacter freundii]|uniref:glutathione binding-like protein n=1 Tax=Citrobacter freundii TaxID=546 RepID=UPI000E2CCD02
RCTMEAKRILDVLDKQLAQHQYLAGDEYTNADMADWPWFGKMGLGNLYDGTEFLDGGSYKHEQPWAKELAARPADKRGRIVNRTTGPLNEQLYERHDASDFDTNTEDKRTA